MRKALRSLSQGLSRGLKMYLPPENTFRFKLFPFSKFTIHLFQKATGHSIIEPTIKFNLGGYNNMKNNRYLTIGLLTGFIVGGCMGVLGWAFLQNLFAIPICAGIGMLIGIVIGTVIDYEKNQQRK